MWRRRQIDLLTDQNVELSDGVPDTFELWQVRMEIECADALKKAETIKRGFDFNRRWQPVGLGRRMKPVAVLDRDAQPREERACEPAEHLLRRYGFIAVVEKIRELTAKKLAMGKVGDIANVVMRAHKGQMIGLREEFLHGFDFTFRGFLAGAERVKTDNDERVGAV